MRLLTQILLSTYLFLLPWDGLFLIELNFPFSPSFIPLGFVAVIYVFLLLKKRKILVPQVLKPLILLFFYMLLSLLWTPALNEGLSNGIRIVSYVATAIILYNLSHAFKINVQYLIMAFLLGVFLVGVYSFQQVGFSMQRFSIAGGFNPSWYAAFLLWGVIFADFLSKLFKRKHKIFFISTILFMLFLLLLTQGRNSILALVASYIFVIIINFIIRIFTKIKKRSFVVNLDPVRLKTLFSFFGVFTIIISFYILFNYLNLWDNIERVFLITELIDGDPDRATAGRTIIWDNYLQLFDNNIIFGEGVRAHDALAYSSPHNNYITLLYNFGILGFLLWMIFLGKVFKLSLIMDKNRTFLFRWFFFATLFLGIGNDILYYKYWWIGLTILILVRQNNFTHSNLENSKDDLKKSFVNG